MSNISQQLVIQLVYIAKDDMVEPKETKVLGLNWRCTTDEIYFDFTDLIAYFKTLPATKRSVLQFSAKIFDPLGVLSPFTTQQKILFQHLCVQGVNWDDPLDSGLLKKWSQLPKESLALSQIRIPRCYFSVQKGGFALSIAQIFRCVRKGICCSYILAESIHRWFNR